MRYRQVGASGLTVSVVGLGGNTFGRTCDLAQTRAIVDTALEMGITHIDTAERYGGWNGGDWGRSEVFLGEALRGRRHAVVRATKFGSLIGKTSPVAPGARQAVRLAIEGSLRRLLTDYLDVDDLHVPHPRTPVIERSRR
jgi:aryl-alcohol dehydrogenase-like predicted oxidoreductase